MSIFSKIIFPALVFLLVIFSITTSRAEKNLSDNQQKVIRSMAEACPGNWTDKKCQKAITLMSTQTSITCMKSLMETQNSRYVYPINTVCQKNSSLAKLGYPIDLMIKKHDACLNIMDKTMKQTGTTYPNSKSLHLFKNALSCMKKENSCTDFEKKLIDIAMAE